MKIAIINYNFTGTTISLAKAFLDKGHHVDLYCGIYLTQNNEMEAFQVKKIPRIPGVWKINTDNCTGLQQCKSKKFNFYIISTITSGYNLRNIFNRIAFFISKLQVKIHCNFLRMKRYDYVCVIGQDPISIYYNVHIGEHIFNTHTFHEVLVNHLANNKQLLPVVTQTISKNINIIVHSEYNKNIILENNNVISDTVHFIPFGKYISYLEFKDTTKITEISKAKDYILFIGYITPYKGLSTLYHAIQTIEKKLSPDIKVVIAGKGNDSITRNMMSNNRFILIHRWLTNNEIVTLIKKSKIIVCPYLSASQSGIPQTAFVFNKPVIATNVGAFSEIIENNINGWLIPKEDPSTLGNLLLNIYNNDIIYTQVIQNIKTDNYKDKTFVWTNIIDKYIDIIKRGYDHKHKI